MRRRKLGTTVQVNLRIQEELRRQLEAAAKEHHRSFNQELTARLTESFQIESLDGFLYKLGMVAARVQGKRAETFVGQAIREAQEAKFKTPQQQEQKAEAKS